MAGSDEPQSRNIYDRLCGCGPDDMCMRCYFLVSPQERDALHAWIDALGVDHTSVFEVHLRGESTLLRRYKRNDAGKRYVDQVSGQPAEELVTVPASPPPVWKRPGTAWLQRPDLEDEA